jgi:hypothetical protein
MPGSVSRRPESIQIMSIYSFSAVTFLATDPTKLVVTGILSIIDKSLDSF